MAQSRSVYDFSTDSVSVFSCGQLLRRPADAAKLHNGVESPGETKHQLGPRPGTGPAESQPQHPNQHGLILHAALDVGSWKPFAHLREWLLLFPAWNYFFIYWHLWEAEVQIFTHIGELGNSISF